MPTRRTWWAKLRRADRHLEEFKAQSVGLRKSAHPLTVDLRREQLDFGEIVVVRGRVPDLPEFEDLAAVVGDIIANTRDALDHLYTAFTQAARSTFPIFVEDPTTTTASRDLRRSWQRVKSDLGILDRGVARILEEVQPFRRFPQFPRTDQLAVLQRLSNADKHRGLHVVVGQIHEPVTTVRIPGREPQRITRYEHRGISGAVIAWLQTDEVDADGAQVEAYSGIDLALRELDGFQGYWEMPTSLESLVGYVRTEVVVPLDAFIS